MNFNIMLFQRLLHTQNCLRASTLGKHSSCINVTCKSSFISSFVIRSSHCGHVIILTIFHISVVQPTFIATKNSQSHLNYSIPCDLNWLAPELPRLLFFQFFNQFAIFKEILTFKTQMCKNNKLKEKNYENKGLESEPRAVCNHTSSHEFP